MRVFKNFPDDEKVQAGIVIPSYDEGDGILPTIEAWVLQSITSQVRAALFVVVNNPKKSPAKIKESNRLTHELIQAFIEGGEDPRKFEEKSWKEFARLRDLIQGFRFRLALVDLWSKEHAPQKCNVGMARDLGSRVAGEYVRDDGFLVMTDADTTPGKSYLFHADLYLRKHPHIAALKGEVYTEGPKNFQDGDRMNLYYAVHTLEDQMRLLSRMRFGKFELKPFPHLAGSNAVVRKSVYELVGGIPHINGAEDTELSRKILRKGLKIHDAGYRLSVDTSSRISLRTDARHGMGQAIKEADDYSRTPYNAPVFSLEACEFAELLALVVADVNREISGKTHWKFIVARMMSERGNVILEDDDLEDLWQANQNDPTLTDIHFNRVLLKEIERIAEEFFEKIPFYRALAQLRSALRLPPHRLGFFDYLRQAKNELSELEEALNNEWYDPRITRPVTPVVQEKSKFEDLEEEHWFDDLLVVFYFLAQSFLKKPGSRVH